MNGCVLDAARAAETATIRSRPAVKEIQTVACSSNANGRRELVGLLAIFMAVQLVDAVQLVELFRKNLRRRFGEPFQNGAIDRRISRRCGEFAGCCARIHGPL